MPLSSQAANAHSCKNYNVHMSQKGLCHADFYRVNEVSVFTIILPGSKQSPSRLPYILNMSFHVHFQTCVYSKLYIRIIHALFVVV